MTTRIRAGLRIPYQMNTTLILIAQERGVSKNALILQILRGWLESTGAAIRKTNESPDHA